MSDEMGNFTFHRLLACLQAQERETQQQPTKSFSLLYLYCVVKSLTKSPISTTTTSNSSVHLNRTALVVQLDEELVEEGKGLKNLLKMHITVVHFILLPKKAKTEICKYLLEDLKLDIDTLVVKIVKL
ncbi:hypothetical protein FRX31_032043 [Thalictrum thalictroides]|uniref:Uncharacterized protein n=1 Tax=Thalictrum thalictroides TaxID=46969 RepID=A0A7J6V0Y5_THATH|nr:hypothetical protein FRX31_032043 [Thalictrum thalictroides]